MRNIPRENSIIPYNCKRKLHVTLVTLVLLIDIVMFIVFLWFVCQNPRNIWCFLPWLLIGPLVPFLFWRKRAKEVTVDKATLEKLFKDNNLYKFKKYHLLEDQFNSLDLEKYLKQACLRPFEEEATCPGETDREMEHARKKCEIIAERLTGEHEKVAKELAAETSEDRNEVRTAMLAEQIKYPRYDEHKEEETG